LLWEIGCYLPFKCMHWKPFCLLFQRSASFILSPLSSSNISSPCKFSSHRSKMFEMSFQCWSYDTSKLGQSNNSLSNLFSEVAALVQCSVNQLQSWAKPNNSKNFQTILRTSVSTGERLSFSCFCPCWQDRIKAQNNQGLELYLRLGQYH
jgi:hypothetical protein